MKKNLNVPQSIMWNMSTRSRRRSPRSLDALSAVEVKACVDFPSAKGLFATRDIPKGSVVARMPNPRPAGDTLWQRIQKGSAGGDAAVQRPDGVWVTSSGFSEVKRNGDFERAPRWYRMNHSDRPNTKVVILEGLGMEWRTLRDVGRGEALTWNYGRRDPRWPRAAFCPSARP